VGNGGGAVFAQGGDELLLLSDQRINPGRLVVKERRDVALLVKWGKWNSKLPESQTR